MVTSYDVPGLATEEDNLEGLIEKLKVMIPELFDVNEELLRSIYKKMHTQTTIKDVSEFLEKLKSNKDKSELAHRLAVKLSKNDEAYDNVTVPQYIKDALMWVIEG